jgi:hypothetical protein
MGGDSVSRVCRLVQLDENIKSLDNDDLTRHIQQTAEDQFGQSPKQLQVESVLSLARRQHTFLLAGTGFGKSRIAEMLTTFLV